MDPIIEATTASRPTTNSLDLQDIVSDRVVLSNDLRLYIREAWPVAEPSTVDPENWHIDLIAEHLEAVTAGIRHNALTRQHGRFFGPPLVVIRGTTPRTAVSARP